MPEWPNDKIARTRRPFFDQVPRPYRTMPLTRVVNASAALTLPNWVDAASLELVPFPPEQPDEISPEQLQQSVLPLARRAPYSLRNNRVAMSEIGSARPIFLQFHKGAQTREETLASNFANTKGAASRRGYDSFERLLEHPTCTLSYGSAGADGRPI